ncbi:MAG: family 20 glycosylhydrolase [Bacteroidota bacterium]
MYQFLTDVLDEEMELFPSKVIHIGGDEVKYEHWKASESVNAYMIRKRDLLCPGFSGGETG